MSESNYDNIHYRDSNKLSRSPQSRPGRRINKSRSPRTPPRQRGNFQDDRTNPKPNNTIGVFGLSSRTTEEDLFETFEKFGKIDNVKLIKNRETNESRGFCFITFEDIEGAAVAVKKAHGMDIDGRPIRIEYSLGKTTRDEPQIGNDRSRYVDPRRMQIDRDRIYNNRDRSVSRSRDYVGGFKSRDVRRPADTRRYERGNRSRSTSVFYEQRSRGMRRDDRSRSRSIPYAAERYQSRIRREERSRSRGIPYSSGKYQGRYISRRD